MYEQVKDDILSKIQSGEFSAGTRIPSEKEMTASYGVSTITVRRAVAELVEQNILERKQGKGTFVLQRTFRRIYTPFYAQSFSDVCRANGMVPSARLLCAEIVAAPPANILKQLDLPPNASCVHIKRLRFADHQPIVIETCWFSMHYAYLLHVDLDNISMYDVIQENEKGIRIAVQPGNRVIRIAYVTPEEAQLLEVKPGTPVLRMQSDCFDETTGRPVHTSCHLGYAQKYNFAIVL